MEKKQPFHEARVFPKRHMFGLPIPRLVRLGALVTVTLFIWLLLQVAQAPSRTTEQASSKTPEKKHWDGLERDPNLDREYFSPLIVTPS